MAFSELGAAAETVPVYIEHVSLEAKWSEGWPDCGFGGTGITRWHATGDMLRYGRPEAMWPW